VNRPAGIRRGGAASGLALLLVLGAVPAAAQSLPLGDGHVSRRPEVGSVYACRTTFRTGGARHAGDWIRGDRWDPAAKPHVAGRVMWPSARFSVTVSDSGLVVRSNGLPVDEPTGRFPITPADPAYRYDTNPNRIEAQGLAFVLTTSPTIAAEPGCLPMGMIGVTTTGVALYSALDDAGRDAAAHEVQDLCDGHPQGRGQYHYHGPSPCLPGVDADSLVGWALDGFPILGERDAAGAALGDADLDACHGRAEEVVVDGRSYPYAYRVTPEYPYTLGCFTGPVPAGTFDAIRRALGPPAHRPRAPVR